MPNKTDPADEIHGALSSFSRNTTRATRICQEIADRQRALETAEDAITAAVLILTPLLERQPKDTAYRYLDTVYWLDPTEGICHRSLREWTDLTNQDDDDEPAPGQERKWDACWAEVEKEVEPEPVVVTCERPGCGNGALKGSNLCQFHIARDVAGRPIIVPDPAKPLSFGEQQARQRYEPLTDAQIDEGAFYEAVKAEPSMPDAVLEAMAEAWDRGDLDATQAIVNAVAANGRGA